VRTGKLILITFYFTMKAYNLGQNVVLYNLKSISLMENRLKLYFLALIPDENVSERVQEIKNDFKEKYNAVVALKSPAHITLQPPIKISEELEQRYIEKLSDFKFYKGKFEIELKNFAAFVPRTIYIDVVANTSLLELQKDFSRFLEDNCLITSDQIDRRPYTAHMTVANRDLKQEYFKTAWKSYKDKPFDAKFEVSGFSLLKHNGTTWEIIKSFNF